MSSNAVAERLSLTRPVKATLSVAVFGMMMGLVGCNNASTPAEDAETQTPTTEEASNDSTVATAGDDQVVTIYSSRNEQLIKPLLDKYTEETGVKIELVTDKTGPLMA
ncbi:Fe(3+) ABC transporter substrate-binding protein, partial [Psychrobacter sp. 1U2]